VLLEDGQLRLIRRRQTFEDLMAGQVDAEVAEKVS
jgi:diaminopimelate decarboxylase